MLGPMPCSHCNGKVIAKPMWALRDLFEMVTYRGLWNLARKHYREGLAEVHRSLSKKAFVRDLQRLIPEVTEGDLVPTKSGIRAQALKPDGTLVNDFLLRLRTELHPRL